MSNKYYFLTMDIDDPKWVKWIAARPESHLFHHPAWIKTISACYGYHPFIAGIVDENGQMAAGVPVVETTTTKRARRWVSLPFTDYCQPLVEKKQALAALQSGIIKEAGQNHVAKLELRWGYPSKELHQTSEFVRTIVPLQNNVDKISEKIKSNHRRKLHSAVKRGIQIQHGTSLEFMKSFYQLQVETRRRLGVPVQPWRFFEIIQEKILEPGFGFISLAVMDTEVLAGVVFFYWNQHLIYKFSASNEIARKNYASDLVIWDAIEWGCANGAVDLDLGRSENENEGLRQYKLRWVGQEDPLIYTRNYQHTSAGLQSRLQPVLAAIIQHSPEWVCQFLGQKLYRYFG